MGFLRLALRYWAVALVIAIAEPWPAAFAQQPNREVVPRGTLVPVRVAAKLSSATANPGDTFPLRAGSDISVEGWIVIRKGALGQGEVTSAAPAHGAPGALGLRFDWITLADGHKARLSTQRAVEGDVEAAAAQPMVIRANSGDVHVDASLELPAFTSDNVLVAVTARSAPAPVFAPTVASAPTPTPTPEPTPTPTPEPTPTPTPRPTPAPTPTPRPTPSPTPEPTPTPAPPSPAPVPSPTTVPIPSPIPRPPLPSAQTGATVFELRGTGPRTTLPFSASGSWGLTYSYDCSSLRGSAPSFSLRLTGAPIYIPPIERDETRASDTIYVHQSGTFFLQIETPCAWHVKAFNQSPDSNVGDAF
ncbi:MAG: hypothetical protein JO192_06460 [Candidatus Eremiobacteraeota bacterium]|nr:hypothetical protein [Candidatus Eremiobacteraeota bacterium]